MTLKEKIVFILATLIISIVGWNTSFSDDFINLVAAVSGALVMLGIVAAAAALLWRRIRIRRNRSVYGDKAEIVERSVDETLIYVAKGFVGLWFLLVVIGLFETLKQHL
jgi:hypothetical protein